MKVEKIVQEGRAEDTPAKEVAKRIIEQAVIDERELRIVRALLGEDEGRSLYSYQNSYYRPALDSLLAKGFIRSKDAKYFLTDKGLEAARSCLLPVLSEVAKAK